VQTLAVPVYYQIHQILISPSGFFLAICTEHTVHIAVLPDPSRLKERKQSSLKVKTYQLGPTVHVIPESPLVSVLWHPLAHATTTTDCLVTVTAEAAVRLWEFDKSSNWSFDRPQLAIDLRKLADGVSCDQDFEPSGFGKRRGFSVDTFDMEVSAACFGGRAGEDEDAWASMTLWVAMRNGDLYALCPLLPSRWRPTSTTIPSLTTAAISRMALINDDEVDVDERRAARQQYEWVQEIDNEEPEIHQFSDGLGQCEVRFRPQQPSAIPRLQGPFTVAPEDDDTEIEISDVYVFPARLDEEDLFDGEDENERDMPPGPPVPFTTICVATHENQVLFSIDLDGVTGQWLPKKGKGAFSVPSSDAKPLTLVDNVSLAEGSRNATVNWPIFTPDIVYQHSLFLTTANHVYSFSLNDWITQLGAELAGSQPVDPGLQSRLRIRCQNSISVTDKLINTSEPSEILSAPTVVDDESVGYLLLASTGHGAYGVAFDRDYFGASTLEPLSTELSFSPSRSSPPLVKTTDADFDLVPAREPYSLPRVFYQNQHIPIDSLRKQFPPHLRKAVTERPMKLSPAMLEIMTSTHRVVGVQSHVLETAASELFRRCERLRDELGSQVKQMAELADQLQRLSATEGEDEYGKTYRIKSPEERLQDAREKQKSLVARYEALRRKVGRVGSGKRDLSSKEVAWIEEIGALGKNLGVVTEEREQQEGLSMDKRFDTVSRRFFSPAFHHFGYF
jgi:nucleoporin NUP82